MDAFLLVLAIHTGVFAFAYFISGTVGFSDDPASSEGAASSARVFLGVRLLDFSGVASLILGAFTFIFDLSRFVQTISRNWGARPEARRALFIASVWMVSTVILLWLR